MVATTEQRRKQLILLNVLEITEAFAKRHLPLMVKFQYKSPYTDKIMHLDLLQRHEILGGEEVLIICEEENATTKPLP